MAHTLCSIFNKVLSVRKVIRTEIVSAESSAPETEQKTIGSYCFGLRIVALKSDEPQVKCSNGFIRLRMWAPCELKRNERVMGVPESRNGLAIPPSP